MPNLNTKTVYQAVILLAFIIVTACSTTDKRVRARNLKFDPRKALDTTIRQYLIRKDMIASFDCRTATITLTNEGYEQLSMVNFQKMNYLLIEGYGYKLRLMEHNAAMLPDDIFVYDEHGQLWPGDKKVRPEFRHIKSNDRKLREFYRVLGNCSPPKSKDN